MNEAADDLDVAPDIRQALKGTVFEVRQGYKSKDSKRQNADIDNAAVAYTRAYLPCVVLLSGQIDHDLVTRYREGEWVILTGSLVEGASARANIRSTYAFVREVIGFDLADFFERNQVILRAEMEQVLRKLLDTDGKAS